MTKAIFIPGLLCTRALYGPQIEALGDRLDIAVGDHTQHDTMSAIAAHILDNAPERFVLVGLSMGGYISQEIMRQAGGRVEALILIDTGARGETAEQSERRKALIALAQTQGLGPVIDTLLPLFVAEEALANEALVETIRAMTHETGPEAFARQQKAIIGRPDSRPSLPDIACPTLVVVGEKDVLTPPELSREIADAIPRAQLVTIAGSGHMATLEKPDAVNAAMETFLQGEGLI